MSAVTIALFVGTHILGFLLGMLVHSLVIEREDRIAVRKTEDSVAYDEDLMALADIFIPKK